MAADTLSLRERIAQALDQHFWGETTEFYNQAFVDSIVKTVLPLVEQAIQQARSLEMQRADEFWQQRLAEKAAQIAALHCLRREDALYDWDQGWNSAIETVLERLRETPAPPKETP